MTKIEAINDVLFYINEMRINSMNDMTPEAQDIDELIIATTREVCLDGMPFNVLPITLTPDINGEITLSNDILSIDPDACNAYRVIRKKLYDIKNKTYVFENSINVECKMLFDFEELEDIVQDFIVKKVIVKKVSVDLGNSELVQMAMYQLDISNNAYSEYNLALADYNFNDSFEFERYYHNIED